MGKEILIEFLDGRHGQEAVLVSYHLVYYRLRDSAQATCADLRVVLDGTVDIFSYTEIRPVGSGCRGRDIMQFAFRGRRIDLTMVRYRSLSCCSRVCNSPPEPWTRTSSSW